MPRGRAPTASRVIPGTISPAIRATSRPANHAPAVTTMAVGGADAAVPAPTAAAVVACTRVRAVAPVAAARAASASAR